MKYAAEQWVEAPLEAVFRFFCSPPNLLLITPPEARARIVSQRLRPMAGHIGHFAGPGSEVTLAFQMLPFISGLLPQSARPEVKWTARIEQVEWPSVFRDIQVEGPFRHFEHTHGFRAERRSGREGTVIHDSVEYEVGVLGPLGAAAARLMLWRMFRYRQRATARQFTGERKA